MMLNKNNYDILVLGCNEIPIFYKPWYLNSVCGENGWECFCVQKSEEIWAVLIAFEKKYSGLRVIEMPPLTQYAGPYIHFPDGVSTNKKHAIELEMIEKLLEEAENTGVDAYAQKWGPWLDNWLAPYWKKYNESSRITFTLSTNNGYEWVLDNYSTQVRNKLKNKDNVFIYQSENIGRLYGLLEDSLCKYNKTPKFTLIQLENMFQAITENSSGFLYLSEDKNRNLLAGALFLEDETTVYYYIAGTTQCGRKVNAPTLLLDTGIKYACSKKKKFDFTGSMLPGVSRFYQSFGAAVTNYHIIDKQYNMVGENTEIYKQNYKNMVFKF